MEESSVL